MSKSYALQIDRTVPIAQSADAKEWHGGTVWSLTLFGLFVLMWTLYGVVSASPAAIHNDMAEAYAWGREFQLGYEKHPPFWAWIAGLWFEIFPRRLGIYSSRGAGTPGCYRCYCSRVRRGLSTLIAPEKRYSSEAYSCCSSAAKWHNHLSGRKCQSVFSM